MAARRPRLIAILAAVALLGAARAADPPGGDFAAAKRDAQSAVKSSQPAKRQGAFEPLVAFPTAESVDTIIRLGLKAKDEPTRSAARRALAGLAGMSMAIDEEPSAPTIDPEAAADVRRHLHDLLDRELKGKALPGPVAIGLATALVAAEDPGAQESLFASLDGGGITKGAPLCWGIATAAASDGDIGVGVLRALSELQFFAADFSFRRGVVRGLINLHAPASVVALVDLLDTLPGEVRADVAGYLAAISGKNHGVDADAWRAWWESEGGDFEFPPRAPFYPAPTVAPGNAGNAYYEIPVYADRIVFVIDTSSSMEGERMETAKRELVSAIHTLDPLVAFTVISFSDAARAWQPQLVAAGDDAKRSAAAYVSALTAAGKTASFDALDAAFRYDAEAIFFLSDGEPTAGRMVNPAQIIRFVAEANKNRRLSLHTIGIMPDNGLAQFLQVLATANNGAYRHVAD
ncbi:MAG: VWA domain-containing protein [Planctomycetota bacterium]|nr:VWA domain-containing protein [Planctomycetota bacterium]